MAADSAATYRRGEDTKVFPSANKIFTLSKRHPIGIMIYGNAEFIKTPWETVIKYYRERLASDSFNTLPEFANAFLKFVKGDHHLVKTSDELFHARQSILAYLSLIEGEIRRSVTTELENKNDIDKNEIPILVNRVIESHERQWSASTEIPDLSPSARTRVLRKLREILNVSIPRVFETLLSPQQEKRVRSLATNVFLKWSHSLEQEESSGLVIAGFGAEDLFPRLRSYSVRGRFSGVLQFAETSEHRIDISSTTEEAIVPFAQTDVVQTFLMGIAPEYHATLENGFSEILNGLPDLLLEGLDELSTQAKETALVKAKRVLKDTLQQHRRDLKQFRFDRYIQPVLSVLNGLPKDELAAMAESLVSLTSLRRRMSLDPDSVGGPIDVAVISKGDGFIWLRRKHYFRPDLNPQFIANYNKEP